MTYEKAKLVLEAMRMSYICDPNECKLDEYDADNIACKMCDEGHEALAMAIEALENLPPENSLCYGCHDDCDNCESMAMMMV